MTTLIYKSNDFRWVNMEFITTEFGYLAIGAKNKREEDEDDVLINEDGSLVYNPRKKLNFSESDSESFFFEDEDVLDTDEESVFDDEEMDKKFNLDVDVENLISELNSRESSDNVREDELPTHAMILTPDLKFMEKASTSGQLVLEALNQFYQNDPSSDDILKELIADQYQRFFTDKTDHMYHPNMTRESLLKNVDTRLLKKQIFKDYENNKYELYRIIQKLYKIYNPDPEKNKINLDLKTTERKMKEALQSILSDFYK